MRALNEWRSAGWRAQEMALIHHLRANSDEVKCWTDNCIEAWTHGGSRHEQAVGIRLRGSVAEQRGDFAVAEQLFRDALTIWRDLKSDEWVANVLNDLGTLEHARERYDAAARYYQEALDIHRRRNNTTNIPAVQGNLGLLAFTRKNWAEARAWFEKALPLAREIGRQS
jgi:tetratricopeptide (TPR) repeat protein